MVFQDETGFTLHPRLGRGWAKKGRRLRIATTSQHRQRLNVSGWVAPLLGRYGMIQTERGDRQGFLQVLGHLYRRLKGHTIWLYVDRARWHRGEPVESFLKAHPRLHLDLLACISARVEHAGEDLAPGPLRSHHQSVVRRPRFDLGHCSENGTLMVSTENPKIM